ncbi:DUF3397 domain-containing protein [Enterococcus nangangensis]
MGLRIFWYIFPVLVLLATRYLVTSVPGLKRSPVKSVDLATFFLVIGLAELSKLTYGHSIFPFWLIGVALIGIGIAVFFGFYYGELEYPRFFKMFWRIVFLMTIFLYGALIIMDLILTFQS